MLKYIQTKTSIKLHNLDKIAIGLAISTLRIVIQNLLEKGHSEERIKEHFGVIILEGIKNKAYKEYDYLTIELKNNIHTEERILSPY